MIYVNRLKNGKLNFGTLKRNEYVPHIYMQTATPVDTNEELVYDITPGRVPKSKALEQEKIAKVLGKTFETGDIITIEELKKIGINTIHNFSEEQIYRLIKEKEERSKNTNKLQEPRIKKEKIDKDDERDF